MDPAAGPKRRIEKSTTQQKPKNHTPAFATHRCESLRLIGQHRQCQASLNRKWDSRIASNSSSVNSQHPKVISNLNKYSKSVGITSYKSIQSVCKQRLSPYNKVNINHQKKSQLNGQGEQNLKVYVNPKFSSGSVENQHASIDSKKISQGPKVHINPNFCNKTATETVKVHINPNFRSVIDNKSEVHINPIPKNISATEHKVKVLMNPKFCKLLPANSPHTQLRSLMSNKVHVNPKLVERVLKEKNDSCNFGPKISGNSTNKLVKVPCVDELSNNAFTESDRLGVQKLEKGEFSSAQCSLRKSEFMTLGKRKLVRIERRPLKLENEMKFQEKLRLRRNSISSSKQKPLAVFSPSRTVKKSKSVISKYKLIKLQSSSQMSTGKMCVSTKYKIDRRSISMKNTSQNCSYKNNLILRHKKVIKTPERKRRFSISSTRTSNGNLVWRRTWSLQAKEFKTTNTKLYRIGSSPVLKKKTAVGNSKNANICNKSLVRIGGVLYKSSRNKLTRSNSLNIGSKNKTPTIASKKKGKGISKRQVLFIRGQKFIMDAQGKTLKRLSFSNSAVGNKSIASNYSFGRVDIGGVTFVKKSSNVLIRTNTHKARTLLSYAKQKSIATLMKKLKKNNQPCIFFHKFGRCLRMEKGTCPCVHDRKNVAVCKRFLQAKCSIDGCLLSHDVVPEKMPTCRYFLEGCCNRANCPYLHVKVNAKADICTKFLQGYCSDGRKCKKRHVRICPDFEKKGKCLKGKNCPYPHENGRPKRNFVKKKIPVQASKLPMNNKKFSTELNKAIRQPKGKVELQRYYLAPEETIRQSSTEATSHEKQLNKECSDRLNTACETEVSKTSGGVPVVTNGDVKLSTSKRGYEREKIGALPSFIPL